MNALTVQNPCHKFDWETRMTTDKKIIADYDCNNDYYNCYTEIIIIILIHVYVCVRVTTYTTVLPRVHNSEAQWCSAFIKQLCGLNHVHEMK